MFNLETGIDRWRTEMAAAGVTDAEVLRELESHLREDFEASVASGMTPETAFAEVVARLGRPTELRQELEKTAPWTLQRVLRWIFPSDLRFCALAALFVASWVIFIGFARIHGGWRGGLERMQVDLISGRIGAYLRDAESLVYMDIFPLLLGILGLVGAIGFWRWRRPAFVQMVAIFWAAIGTSAFRLTLYLALTLLVPHGGWIYALPGVSYLGGVGVAAGQLDLVFSIVAYLFWRKRLDPGVSKAPPADISEATS